MKALYTMILLSFLSCSVQKKLQVETILTKTMTRTSQDALTGRKYNTTTRIYITSPLEPKILLKTNHKNKLTFSLQGNISSGGLSINRLKKIRFEKGEQSGDTLTLKYFVEIKRVPGKERANVVGYNYIKRENYKIPNEVKVIHIELYEDFENQSTQRKPKLITEETFVNLNKTEM